MPFRARARRRRTTVPRAQRWSSTVADRTRRKRRRARTVRRRSATHSAARRRLRYARRCDAAWCEETIKQKAMEWMEFVESCGQEGTNFVWVQESHIDTKSAYKSFGGAVKLSLALAWSLAESAIGAQVRGVLATYYSLPHD